MTEIGAPPAAVTGRGPWAWVRGRFVSAAGGLSVLPLLVLFGLNFVDEFDSAAFGVVAPEVKAAFGLTNASFGAILAINFVVVIALSIAIGYLSDQVSRVRVAQIGAVVAGIGSVLTGLAPVVWFLVAARLINGAGLLVNGPVHTSLLADYYKPDDRGNVIALHQSATPFGRVLGPAVVGLLASVASWRAPFIVASLPLFAFFVLSLRLREPVRGGTEHPDEAFAAEEEKPVPFGRGVRMLAQSKTLRRTWVGLVFVGAGLLPLVSFLAFFYDTVFGAGSLARGLIGTLGSAGSLAGLLLAGRFVRMLLERYGPARIQLLSGGVLVLLALLLIMFALQRYYAMAVAIGTVIPFVGGIFAPCGLTVQTLVCPPRVRTLGLSFGALFLAAGAFLTPVAGNVADVSGLRWGLIAFSPLLAVGGVVIASANRFVDADVARAAQTLATTVELRRQRLAAADRSLLVCRDVDVSYGRVQVLFDVDLEIKEGEIVALLGTNGAGKSTMLKAIAGLLTPERGVVFFDGEEVSAMAPWEAAAHGVVLMPGGKSVFPTMSVRENLRLAGYLYRKDPAYIERRTDEVLEIFPVLASRIDTPAGDLSGGEQQMVSLAQTLIARPRLLLIDELSLGLAPKVVAELLEIVRAIHKSGVTIVIVEQSVNIALQIAKRAYFMEKGEIRFSGKTKDLLRRPDILRAVFLEGAATSAPRRRR